LQSCYPLLHLQFSSESISKPKKDMIRRTKIVATLGPSTEEKSDIKKVIDAGMNIARLNFSHGTYEQYKKITKNIRAVDPMVTIMQDLQGPKIRLGDIEDHPVKKGEVLTFSTKKGKGVVHVPYKPLPKIVKKGEPLLIEDGLIRTKVLSMNKNTVRVKVLTNGILKSKKGINLPETQLPASASLTRKDKKDLAYGIKTLKVDAVAMSFVEDPEDILRLKKEIQKHTKRDIPVIAKIERNEALNNLEEIIDAADGVMVARGDLGIEVKPEQVPIIQKRILKLARKQNKPVIIATQILQSMVEKPLATRAEISDAANSIFELADAFMLSNETAVGAYPFKAVKTLARVAKAVEKELFKHTELFPVEIPNDEDESIALSAAKIAEDIDAKAIVVMTKGGFTARAVLKHRPKTPVVVVTDSLNTARTLNFLWGINETIIHKGVYRSEEIKSFLTKKKHLKKGDDIVLIKLSDKKRSLVVMSI
jgi:pyruvate kinase